MADQWLRNCREGNHQACGCRHLDQQCCLKCPLDTCILDVNWAPRRPRKIPLDTPTMNRAIQLFMLQKRGHTPPEIRTLLSISREQYSRALRRLRLSPALVKEAAEKGAA